MAFTFAGQTGNFTVDYILQNIIDDTGRSDKVEEMKRRVQRAVMYHHMKDFYKKDHFDAIYVFLTTATQQSIDTTLLQRFRSLSYARKYQTLDVNGNPIPPTTEGGDLVEVAPEKAFDGYGFDQLNVMYRSGSDIKIRSSTPVDQLFIGYYQYPLIEPITVLESWIAIEHPALIAATAKARIFKDIGKDDEYKGSKEEEAAELLVLQTNNLRLQVM